MKHKQILTLLFSLACTAALATDQPDLFTNIKQKIISKSYSVTTKDRLNISNKYGKVTINVWDKNEIKTDVTIIGTANSDEKAQELLETVTIIDSRSEGLVMFKTEIETHEDSWWNWSISNGSKKGVEINYEVWMPKNNALILSNSYGKTVIGDFAAALSVTSNYGSLQAGNLAGKSKEIKLAYGKATVQGFGEGNIKSSYSSMEVENAGSVVLQNTHSSISFGHIENLNAGLSYSTSKIGKLDNTAKVSVSYGGIDIRDIDKNATNIDIKASYSSTKLGVNAENSFDFDVATSYGGFSAPSNKTQYSQNSDNDDRGSSSKKAYKGHIGKNTPPTKIYVSSSYGSIKFVE
jgi:hypothetical protein